MDKPSDSDGPGGRRGPQKSFANFGRIRFHTDTVMSVTPHPTGGVKITYVKYPDQVIPNATVSHILRLISQSKANPADSD